MKYRIDGNSLKGHAKASTAIVDRTTVAALNQVAAKLAGRNSSRRAKN